MGHFYEQVVRGCGAVGQDRTIDVNAPVSDVLRALVGAETWPDAFKISIEQSPENAVSYLRERVKIEIKKFCGRILRRAALLPGCTTAHRGGRAWRGSSSAIDRSTWRLPRQARGLLPGNFTRKAAAR